MIMSFNEDAWLASVQRLDAGPPDYRACVSLLKQIFDAPRSFFDSLNARLQAADKMALIREPEQINADMQDVNEIENMYKSEGDRAFEGYLPDGEPTANFAVAFYFFTLVFLKELEQSGVLPKQDASSSKDWTKDGKKDDKGGKKDSKNGGGPLGGGILGGSYGRQGLYAGQQPQGRDGGYPGGFGGPQEDQFGEGSFRGDPLRGGMMGGGRIGGGPFGGGMLGGGPFGGMPFGGGPYGGQY